MKTPTIGPDVYEELKCMAELVSDMLKPYAARMESKSTASSIATLFRPFLVEASRSDEEKAKSKETETDQRERCWDVRCYVWQVWDDGTTELLADNETPDRVQGLKGVALLVQEYCAMHGPGPNEIEGRESVKFPFTSLELDRRMGSLRPAINRGGGKCSTRWRYKIGSDSFMFQADIARAEQKT